MINIGKISDSWLFLKGIGCVKRMCGSVANASPVEICYVRILRAAFPNATKIKANDVSGGCGAMFEIHVESAFDFSGLRTVQQHKLVTRALKEQIKDMHGIRITTGTGSL